MTLVIYFMGMMYPESISKKKIREIESNLVFALRTLLVEIKSGVSLFAALDMVATGNFGALSREFKHAVNKMNAGYQQEEALQEIATNNPSPFLRKILWQIVNGMKAGGDIADILSESMATTERDQKLAVTKYGNDLKLFSLIYLMIGVIMPALAMTFMIVLGSFPKVELKEMYFWGLLCMVLFMEFMFITLVESKRPTLMTA
jgi:flagellar protein FlaJ